MSLNIPSWIKFEKRDGDWWFFNIAPLVLFIAIGVYLYYKQPSIVLIMPSFVQQLLSYSVVLSSTDLGLRVKLDNPKTYAIWPYLSIVILSAIALLWIYSDDNSWKILIVPSLIMTYYSLWLSNHNPYSNWMINQNSEVLKEESERTDKNIVSRFKKSSSYGGIRTGRNIHGSK